MPLFHEVAQIGRVSLYGCARLRMIFKYTEIVCRKTHDVSVNAYMDS